jgi:hypothetical protein
MFFILMTVTATLLVLPGCVAFLVVSPPWQHDDE